MNVEFPRLLRAERTKPVRLVNRRHEGLVIRITFQYFDDLSCGQVPFHEVHREQNDEVGKLVHDLSGQEPSFGMQPAPHLRIVSRVGDALEDLLGGLDIAAAFTLLLRVAAEISARETGIAERHLLKNGKVIGMAQPIATQSSG